MVSRRIVCASPLLPVTVCVCVWMRACAHVGVCVCASGARLDESISSLYGIATSTAAAHLLLLLLRVRCVRVCCQSHAGWPRCYIDQLCTVSCFTMPKMSTTMTTALVDAPGMAKCSHLFTPPCLHHPR